MAFVLNLASTIFVSHIEIPDRNNAISVWLSAEMFFVQGFLCPNVQMTIACWLRPSSIV